MSWSRPPRWPRTKGLGIGLERTIARRLAHALAFALLVASARSARAAPGDTLLIWGGGRDPSAAVRSLEDFHLAMAQASRRGGPALQLAKGFPMVLESARISGLNPGFFVVALGLCPRDQADQVVKGLRKDSGEGVYTRAVAWVPGGSADQDLCPTLQPAQGGAPSAAPEPKRDCLERDPGLCLVSDPSGGIHVSWTGLAGAARSPALPAPAHFKPEAVVGPPLFSFERSYKLEYWPDSRSLVFDEKTWLGPEETTEGGEDALVSSRHFDIVNEGQRVAVRRIYAYSLSGDTSCNENLDFSSGAWSAKCQRSCRTVQKKERNGGSGEDQFECVPVGELKPEGKILFASSRADGAQRPLQLVQLEGKQPKKVPTLNVRWQPSKLSFDIQLTNADAWPGNKANRSHLDLWLGRETILPWERRVIDQATDGVRHLNIDFDGDRPQVTLVYPEGKTVAKPKPIQGSLTRNGAGWRLQFDLDYADLVGAPRHLKGSRQASSTFQKNELLLFALTLSEGSGVQGKAVFASSHSLQGATPATFNRLLLGEPGQLPELNAAMFGLTP